MRRLCWNGIWVLLCVLCLSGCSFMEAETKSENENEIKLEIGEKETLDIKSEMDFSQGDLYTMFEEVNNEQIENFLYDDYNKDGIHEAFVVTKAQNAYKLWYMSPVDCKIVIDNLDYVDNQNTEILSFETKDYLLLQQYAKDTMNTLVYSVNNDNQVIQASISDKGHVRHNASGEIFLDVYEKTEEQSMVSQQGCITYYMYYVFDDGFREYGAIPIGQEQFLAFQGAQDILDDISERYGDAQLEISYLYRANHYINMNITVYEDSRIEYRNVTLYYDDEKVSYVSGDIAKGKVEIAHLLNIATFPTAFKEPHNNDNR